MHTVAMDIRTNQPTGISRYGLSLLKALGRPAAPEDLRLLVLADRRQDAAAALVRRIRGAELLLSPEPDGFVRRSAWVRDALARSRADLFFTTHYTVDLHCPLPYVYTVHDLTRLRFPEHAYTREDFIRHFGTDEWEAVRAQLDDLTDWDDGEGPFFQRYFRALNRSLAQGARRLVTVSKSTLSDIRSLLEVARERIDLVPCAVDGELFGPRPQAAVEAVRRRYDLGGPYWMYVGLAGPTKRFDWLLRAWLEVWPSLPAGARLVVVGGYAERRPETTGILTAACSEAARSVAFTGRVADAELAALYSGTRALLVSSLNEGNQLGPLEALACGAEVIAGDIPPLRETLGSHAHFYPAHDPAAFRALIAASAGDGSRPRRAAGFRPPRWEASAALLEQSLRRALRAPASPPSP